MKSRYQSIATASFALAMSSLAHVSAETVLIDFGNSSSFRGASQTGADANGLYWTSVYSGAYYSNLIDATNTATSLGFGFSASTGLGTDSYNGPSGATSTPITQSQIDAANINATALGILGGSKASAFDYYVATDGRFVIQGLDADETYNLTFFGSHKFNAVNTTDYAVYSDNTYATSVGSTSLNVGVGSANNTSNTATIAGLAPQTGNTFYVRFGASGYTANGYINELSIVGYVPYTGGGTTTLAAAKTYTGNTILGNASTLNANASGALGGGSSVLQIDAGGGTLSLGASQTVAALIGSGNLALTTGATTLTLNPGGTTSFKVDTSSNGNYAANDYSGVLSGTGTISKTGSGTQMLSGANTFSGSVELAAGTLTLNHTDALQNAKLDTLYGGSGTLGFGLAGSNTYKLGGLFGNRAIDMGTNSLDVSTAGGATFYDGILGGSGGLTKSGANTLTIRGNNTFTGAITINAGTLQVADDGPANGGTIATASGITNNSLLVFNNATNARSYANVISGTGSITKTGAATFTLEGANSYSGNTTVSAGTLLANNTSGSATGSGNVSVASGATLGGTGTVSGAVSVTGKIAPGSGGIGTLNTGAVTWKGASAAGSTTNWEFALGSANASDKLNINGNFTKDTGLGSVFHFDFLGSVFTGIFTLAQWTGSTTFSAGDFSYGNLGGGHTGTFTINGQSLQFTAVPEPTGALAGLLLGAGLLRRRRKA